MRLRALFAAVAFVALSHIGCATPTSNDEVATSQDALDSEDTLDAGQHRAAAFTVPALSPDERDEVFARYAAIPHQGVRDELYEAAILYYDQNLAQIPNAKWLSIVDFQKHSGLRRFFVLDMAGGGPVQSFVVSHGAGSDPDRDGTPTEFGNVPGSGMSSLGFYLTAETYTGGHGLSVKLDGLSDTNSNVRRRVVVIHSATYVEEGRPKQGLSLGCIAFSETDEPWIVENLAEGSLIYASN